MAAIVQLLTAEAQEASTEAKDPIIAVVFSEQGVTLRRWPDREATRVTGLPARSRVTVLASNFSGTWWFVRTEDGDEGWVLANLMFRADESQEVPTATVTLTNTPSSATPRPRPRNTATPESTAEAGAAPGAPEATVPVT